MLRRSYLLGLCSGDLEPPSWCCPPSSGSQEGLWGMENHYLWSVFHALSWMTLAWIAEGYVRLGSHLVKNSFHADSGPQNSIQAKGAQMGQSWARMGKSPFLVLTTEKSFENVKWNFRAADSWCPMPVFLATEMWLFRWQAETKGT